jgi:hypothetical protein
LRSGFSVSRRAPDGTVRVYESVCKSCRREKRAAARGAEPRVLGRIKPRESSSPALPVGPFRAWLKDHLIGLGAWDPVTDAPFPATYGETSIIDVARGWGIPERRIREHLKRGEFVSLGFVDRVLCRAGQPWMLEHLYPEIDEILGIADLPDEEDVAA